MEAARILLNYFKRTLCNFKKHCLILSSALFFKSLVLEQKTNKPMLISNCLCIYTRGLSSNSVNKVHIYENKRRNGESTMTSYINTYCFFFCWADDRLNIIRWHCRRLIWNWVFQGWHTCTCTYMYTIERTFHRNYRHK